MPAQNTSNITEGTNLYYTNARADARIAAASTSDLSEGTNLYYTDARADARVALIVDSAPGTLNTLNELAAALGDDANFSTTVTNSIAAKLPLTGGSITPSGWSAPATHAALNIGYNGSGQTRAIDIDGGWSGSESKAITFTHGSGATNILGQWDVQHNSPGSRMRWGKLYHSADSSTYTMELVSTSTTAADLYVNGSKVIHLGNDGTGSGLDADLLDGQHGSYYTNASNLGSGTVPDARLSSNVHFVTTSASTAGNGNLSIGYDGSTYSYVQSHSSKPLRLNPAGNAVQIGSGNTVWHAGNDGSGSGLDADLLDGVHGTSFLRSDADDSFTGNLTTGANNHITFGPNSSWGSSLRIGGNGRTATGTEMASIVTTDGNIHLDAANSTNGIYLNYYAGTNGTYFGSGTGAIVAKMFADGQLYKSGTTANPYWNSTNDGSGSGLDADLLDGMNATDSRAGNTIVMRQANGYMQAMYVNTTDDASSTSLGWLYGQRSNSDGYHRRFTAASIKTWGGFWASDNDGSGSGLDADLLDGIQASSFLRSDATDTATHINSPIFSGNISTSGDGQNNYPFRLTSDYNSYMVATAGNTWGLFWAGNSGSRYGTNGNGGPGNIWSNSTNPNEFCFVGGDSTKWSVQGSSGDTWQLGTARTGAQGILWGATNDGPNSGLDADLLDGQQGSYYTNPTTLPNGSNLNTAYGVTAGDGNGLKFWNGHDYYKISMGNSGEYHYGPVTDYSIKTAIDSNSSTRGFTWGTTGGTPIAALNVGNGNMQIGGTFASYGATFTGQVNIDYGSPKFIVGSTSNLDLSDANRPNITLNGGMYPHMTIDARVDGSGNPSTNTAHGPVFSFVSRLSAGGYRRWAMGTSALDSGALSFGYYDNQTNPHYGMGGNAGYTSTGSKMWLATTGHLSTSAQGTLWGATNDGPNSGLDADLLDGQQGSYYQAALGTSARWPIAYISGHGAQSYDKLRVWDDSNYSIGMYSGQTYGWLNDYAMTFQMNNDTDRGFVWRHSAMAASDGAMSLTTNGNLSVKNAISLGGSTSYYMHVGSWGWRHQTPSGYIEFGPANTTWAHIYSSGMPFYFNNNLYVNGNLVWAANTDGPNSGLDADTVDGVQASTIQQLGVTQTVTGVKYYNANRNTTSNSPPLQVYGTTSGAIMSFHRGGYYAVNMGLDSDNVFRIGGWSAATNRFVMDMSGNLTMAGNITAYSDSRLKENVEVIGNALSKVQAMRGVTFTRNDVADKEERHAGVIAQEVEVVFPEVVSENNEGIKNVAYGNMVGLLIEAIKELKDEVDELKRQLKEK
jgi:hypothetical protein